MRILLAILLIFNFAYCAKEKSTKEKIMQTNKNLQVYANQKDELNEKIKKTASEILQEEKSLKKYQNDIDELSSVVSNLKEKYKDSQTELNKLNSQNAAIIGLQKDIEDKIVSLISKELAFDLINTQSEKSLDSIITNEVVDVISKNASKELAALAKNYETNQNFINEQDKKITSIKSNMQDYNKKKDELNQKQVEQNKKIDNLKKSKDDYITQLEKLNNEQEAMQKTLEELKIIDDKEEKEKAEKLEKERIAKLEKEKERKKALAVKKGQNIETAQESEIKDARVEKINQKVKQYGSSYQSSRVKKYTGAKTISPLQNPVVKRKFGNYSDPVYNIKIFNESVTLGSKSGDNRVKSVLPGKIVFAKETSVLDRVIIIAHKDGIHTIYAHLSQIAPTIKVGSSVSKGYTIGKISNDLTFEVTQKNYHINPLELISLK